MKKLLALMLAAAMSLSLAACGGNNGPAAGGSSSGSSDGSSSSESSVSSAGSSQDSSQEPSQEPGKEFTTAAIGEKITLEGVDIELTTGEFQSDAEKLGGNISVSTHSDSNKYFWLSGTMTNVGKETISSWGVDCMVNIVFDDDYIYEGSLNVRSDMGPFAESEVLFWADVPPAMLDRYETVKVQFAYNDGFAEYNWEAANYEKNMDGYDHKYEFVQGSGGGGAAQTSGGSEAAPGIWSVNYYVDDFQQPTDEWYITANTSFSGTFSNSATTNSKLAVQVAVDAEDIAFFLYEYGRSQVKNPSSNYVDEYDITMRTADGTDHSLSGTVYCGGDRLMIEGKDMDTVLAAMKDGGTISFHIVESDRTTTSYLFSLEASNFSQVYEEMAG